MGKVIAKLPKPYISFIKMAGHSLQLGLVMVCGIYKDSRTHSDSVWTSIKYFSLSKAIC